jgi:hypothetical protein
MLRTVVFKFINTDLFLMWTRWTVTVCKAIHLMHTLFSPAFYNATTFFPGSLYVFQAAVPRKSNDVTRHIKVNVTRHSRPEINQLYISVLHMDSATRHLSKSNVPDPSCRWVHRCHAIGASHSVTIKQCRGWCTTPCTPHSPPFIY